MKTISQSLFTSIVFLILLTEHIVSSETEYQERAATIIMNSIQNQPEESFLKRMYLRLFFTPAWLNSTGLSEVAQAFFTYVKEDKVLSKESRLYQDVIYFEKMASELYTTDAPLKQKIDLEFRISQLYQAYINYTYFGSINWGAFSARISNLMVNDVNTEWVLHRPNVDAIGIVEKALLGQSLTKQLHQSRTQDYNYHALQKALLKYRHIKENGGWKSINLRGKLTYGQKSKYVNSLRERLKITEDYQVCRGTESNRYDKCLLKAVKYFQQRNGLKPDGVVGSATLLALNKSVNERITIIQLNLDRIKWLKQRKEAKRRLIMNIPDFNLYFTENGKLRDTIKTVVGTPKNPTPIFSDTMETVVLNPYWNLPKSIIQKEMIPELLQNSNAMAKQGIEIYTGWEKNAPKVDAHNIDWRKYSYSKVVPFRFAQVPGRKNALGKIKFLFPNKYSVYMHDTPQKHLFSKTKRAFSHGCVRLDKPKKLLKILSGFNSNVDYEKSNQILKGKRNTYYYLKQKIPVDIIYLTAWVDYDGKLQFRNDIYNYDKMQLKSFRKW
jgi:murein L,D-transpeptidase YcbB/YkuD